MQPSLMERVALCWWEKGMEGDGAAPHQRGSTAPTATQPCVGMVPHPSTAPPQPGGQHSFQNLPVTDSLSIDCEDNGPFYARQ